MNGNLKQFLLSIPENELLDKVATVLRLYWEDAALSDLPQQFSLLMEQIRNTPTFNDHHLLVAGVGYLSFPEGQELFRNYVVFDEDELTSDFDRVPEWESIQLWSWEKEGTRLDQLHDNEIRHLNSLPYPEPISANLRNLPVFLSARLPNLHGKKAQEKAAIVYLAMLLDVLSGRRERAISEPKWTLFNKISMYQALLEIRERILERDI